MSVVPCQTRAFIPTSMVRCHQPLALEQERSALVPEKSRRGKSWHGESESPWRRPVATFDPILRFEHVQLERSIHEESSFDVGNGWYPRVGRRPGASPRVGARGRLGTRHWLWPRRRRPCCGVSTELTAHTPTTVRRTAITGPGRMRITVVTVI